MLTHGVNIVDRSSSARTIVIRAANLAIEHLQHRLARPARADRSRVAAARQHARRHPDQPGDGRRSWFVAVLMLLRELSIDVLPILTGAGIAGLAIGFGAQNLVRDVISGFFLILEDQVRVGDIARINGVARRRRADQSADDRAARRRGRGAGVPERHDHRAGELEQAVRVCRRRRAGRLQGELDRVIGTIREVGATMQEDAAWGAVLLAPIEIARRRIDRRRASPRCASKFKTLPLNQGRVANELRRRLMGAFAGRGIKPYA